MKTNSLLQHSLVIFGLMVSSTVHADPAQTPLFLGGSVPPNVMLMLDNSGSMLNIVPEAPYDESITYDCPTATGSTVLPVTNQIEIRITNTGLPYFNTHTTLGAVCNTSTDTLRDWGRGSGNGATAKSKRCFNPTQTYFACLNANSGSNPRTTSGYTPTEYSGNYLNWYFGDTPTSTAAMNFGTTETRKPGQRTRIEIARPVAKNLVDSLTAVRLGLSTYNGQNGGKLLGVVGDLDASKKTAIKNSIDAMAIETFTPLAETLSDIGFYFSRGATTNLTLHPGTAAASSVSRTSIFASNTGDDGYTRSTTWNSGSDPIQYSCQKSFAVLMTDGRPNNDRAISSHLRDYSGDCAGGACSSTPNGTSLPAGPLPNATSGNGTKQGRSYESGGSDYLDDVAKALYDMDLRPDLIDATGTKNNVATYVISFADSQAINDPLIQDTASRGGGQFYAAGNETSLVSAFQTATQHIVSTISSAAAIATNSTRLDTDTLVFQARFNSANWSGQLLAFPVNADGSVGNLVWDTNASGITPGAGRTFLTYNGSAGVPLIWNNLSCLQQGYLSGDNAATAATNCAVSTYYNADTTGQSRLDWLKGANVTGLRSRTHILGDVVNSDPVFVYRENYGHALRDYKTTIDSAADGLAIKTAYATFLTTTKASRTPMLYVGANDGMLHGFKATSTGADMGKALFSYMPYNVYPNLHELTHPNYGTTPAHRFFVDGALASGDACIGPAAGGSPCSWRTVLVGSLGGGGKAVFALDVTDPANISVLWEKSAGDTGWGDLGFLVGAPQIMRVRTGSVYKWMAVFGNGFDSGSGKAVLYFVNLATGAIEQALQVDAGPDNGLSTPALFNGEFNAYIGDSQLDAIYAGDLKGNLWTAQYLSAGTAWSVPYKLFTTATDSNGLAQPITAPLEIGFPATGANTGLMIYFGTGKYYALGDGASTQVQTFYGIWDARGTLTNLTRANLQAQTILQELVPSGLTDKIRVTSNTPIAYQTGANPRGWYMDLVSPGIGGAKGERVVSAPLLRHNRVIFTSIIPSSDPCSFGGTSWLMELDAVSGSRLTYAAFDVNKDGFMSSADYVNSGAVDAQGNPIKVPASGILNATGLAKPPAVIEAGNVEYKITSSTSGQISGLTEQGFFGNPRTSWREIADY
jgi:type IV pilus assembly protein PilY1